MKVIKNIKAGLVVSLIMLTVSACGKGTTPSVLPNGMYGSSCGTMTGANVYTGDILSCQEAAAAGYGYCGYNETNMDGSLVLSVLATGGLVSGQATITGALTVNGSTYCCNAQSLSYVSMPNNWEANAGAKYIVNGITLICQPTNAGNYQSIVLKLGSGAYSNYGPAMVTTDQRFVGAFEIVSGVSFGGTNSNLDFFAR